MKRLVVFLALTVIFTFTQNISAQQWTAEQQEVWKTINAQWQADKDGKNWVEEFVHPDCVGWNNSTPMPRDKASTNRWANIYKTISKTIGLPNSPVCNCC